MLKNNILFTFIIFILCACAAPSYNYKPEVENISLPPLGVQNTVNIGDDMVRQGTIVKAEVLSFDTLTKINFAYSIPPGNYRKTGDSSVGQNFATTSIEGQQVTIRALADPVVSILLKSNKGICLITFLNLASCSTSEITTPPTIRQIILPSDRSFQQTLIYSGRVGNRIKIGYREFIHNMARSDFSNDVEYDLTESKTIGYKGALIEVIDANNQSITYKVIRNFNTTQ